MKTALAIFQDDDGEIFTLSRNIDDKLLSFSTGPIGKPLTDEQIAIFMCEEAEMSMEELYQLFIAEGDIYCAKYDWSS